MRIERDRGACRKCHRLVVAVQTLPVKVPVVDVDQAFGLAGRQLRLYMHGVSEQMHVRSDHPEVDREPGRGGKRFLDRVVGIIRRNGEGLVHQRQHEHRLLWLLLREVDADLGDVRFRRAAMRVIVNLQHNVGLCRQCVSHRVRQHHWPRSRRPTAQRRCAERCDRETRPAKGCVTGTGILLVHLDRLAGGVEVGDDVMHRRRIARLDVDR